MINNKIKIKSFVKQECVKAITATMGEVYKTKNSWGVDKSKTTVSLCTAAPMSLPQFCLREEDDCTQSKQLSVKVLYIVMLNNPRTNLPHFPSRD